MLPRGFGKCYPIFYLLKGDYKHYGLRYLVGKTWKTKVFSVRKTHVVLRALPYLLTANRDRQKREALRLWHEPRHPGSTRLGNLGAE